MTSSSLAIRKKEQTCIRMTPTAYDALIAVTTRCKNIDRGWTNSAIINLLILENKDKFLLMSPRQLSVRLAAYKTLKGTQA